MSTSPPASAPAHRKWQFSLRALLLFLFILALAWAYWVEYWQSRTIQRLTAEHEQIKNEFGEITIQPGTEDNVHIIAVPNPSQHRQFIWKWQVDVPPGKNVSIAASFGPGGGQPPLSMFVNPFGSGALSVELRHDPAGQWHWLVANPEVVTTFPTTISKTQLTGDDFDTHVITQAGRDKTIIAEPGKPLELLRAVATPTFRQPPANQPDKTGIDLWILQK